MVEEVILHIGMPKTGSSSIQASLNGYDDGVTRYASLGDPNHSLSLSTIFSRNPGDVGAIKNAGRSEKEVEDLRRKYVTQLKVELQSPVQKLIISAENIVFQPEGPIEDLHAFLSERSIKARIVTYVRPPLGFASSAFQERLKGQDPRVADLSNPMAVPKTAYRYWFEKFIDVFGRESVTFAKFSGNVLQGSVVDHFCGVVGLPEGRVKGVRVNESLPLEAISLLYHFTREGPVSRGSPNLITARRKMTRLLGNWFGSRFQIPPELITSNWDLADIEWMEDVAGFDLRPTESELAKSEGSGTYRTLEDYVAPISAETLQTLKGHLRQKGIRFLPEDRAVDLVTRLYYSVLIEEGQKG